MLDVIEDDSPKGATSPMKGGKKGKKKGFKGGRPPVGRTSSRTKNEALIARSSGRELNRNQQSAKSLHASKGNIH